MRAGETLAQGVQRTRADVTVDDTEGGKSQESNARLFWLAQRWTVAPVLTLEERTEGVIHQRARRLPSSARADGLDPLTPREYGKPPRQSSIPTGTVLHPA
jgi:hypothetical protein